MSLPENRCLVLMPFADKFKEVYVHIYKPVCQQNGYNCWRVDELNKPGSITRDIIAGIIDSEIIIADLSTRNANVFYELGIAHCLGNKTIMTAGSKKDIPFDIANYRVIIYDQSISGAQRLHSQLDQTIKDLKSGVEMPNNPVQEVMHQYDIRSRFTVLPTSGKKLLLEVVRIDWLKKAVREIIQTENLMYVDDLKRIDFDYLKKTYSIGPSVMAEISGIMLRLKAVTNPAEIHKAALKYRFTPNVGNSAIVN